MYSGPEWSDVKSQFTGISPDIAGEEFSAFHPELQAELAAESIEVGRLGKLQHFSLEALPGTLAAPDQEVVFIMNLRPPLPRQFAVAAGLLIAVSLIAVFGSLATIPNTDGWYATVEKVAWNPPNTVFGPAWTILYILIAIAGWLVWRSGWRGNEHEHRGARGAEPNAARSTLRVYTVQLVLNGLWTPVFFAGYPIIGEAAWWIALIIITALIVTVVWLIASAWKWSKVAAILLTPYLLWLVFASTLNAGIIWLN